MSECESDENNKRNYAREMSEWYSNAIDETM